MIKNYKKPQRKLWKDNVINHYGEMCLCCGEDEISMLTIDHIHGGGGIHRKNIGVKAGYQFYQWLIKSEYPPGFQVLCFNCNISKGANGKCAHVLRSCRNSFSRLREPEKTYSLAPEVIQAPSTHYQKDRAQD